jgi:putative transposase
MCLLSLLFLTTRKKTDERIWWVVNVWGNAAMESFFSSFKTERVDRKTYRTRDEAKADVFDYIERFYNPKRRHSTIGYLSPMEFERQAGVA